MKNTKLQIHDLNGSLIISNWEGLSTFGGAFIVNKHGAFSWGEDDIPLVIKDQVVFVVTTTPYHLYVIAQDQICWINAPGDEYIKEVYNCKLLV